MNLPDNRISGTSHSPKIHSYLTCIGETRLCDNGDCVPKAKLCPEQEEMDSNTILVMIIIGAAVLVFLVILYCIQRSQGENRNSNQGAFESIVGDDDNVSLNMPPPTYQEVISTNLYPRTPQLQHAPCLPSSEEPITPPPNYDTALHILACSQETICTAKHTSPVVRRSVSSENSSSLPNGMGASRVSASSFHQHSSIVETRP